MPIANTDGEHCLISRGLNPPYPLDLWWYPDARAGEGAIVVDLIADNRLVAILLTYVDARGRKSVVEPVRQRFNLEPHHPGAVIPIAAAEPGVVDITCDTVVIEGLENGLSLALVKQPAWAVKALPGIGGLRHLPVRKGERVGVFQDSDPPDSPAAQGLQAGVDALIVAEAKVRITERADGDANAILQATDPIELRRLITKAAIAPLSYSGDLDRLAKLSPSEYERARKDAAARHGGMRVSVLDKEVARRRPKEPDAGDGSTPGLISLPDDPEWGGPIPQLAALLDRIVAVFRRFVAVTEAQLTAVVLWIAAAHLMHSPKVGLELFPKLAIESKDPASGKTTLLTLVWNGLLRAKLWTYPTGAFLARALELGKFSVCLDELQYARDPNLLRIIDASHIRRLAYVPLLVSDKEGGYVPCEFDVWTPMALARWESSARRSRAAPSSFGCCRSCRAKPRAHTRSGCPGINTVPAAAHRLGEDRSQLRRSENPRHAAEQRYRQLGAAPLCRGVGWGRLDEARSTSSGRADEGGAAPTLTARLLRSIWDIYQPDPDEGAIPFLATGELLAKLIADPDEEWDSVGPGGRAITAQWLREKLRHLLNPPGSQRPDHGGPRGYAFQQFDGALKRYFGGKRPEDPIIDP